MLGAINTAVSSLQVNSKKLEVSASNIANVASKGSMQENGKAPYVPQTVQQQTIESGGETIGVKAVTQAKEPAFIPSLDPDSPFADDNGVVGLPNVNLGEEFVNMKTAEISYKASAKVMETAIEMQESLLDITS